MWRRKKQSSFVHRVRQRMAVLLDTNAPEPPSPPDGVYGEGDYVAVSFGDDQIIFGKVTSMCGVRRGGNWSRITVMTPYGAPMACSPDNLRRLTEKEVEVLQQIEADAAETGKPYSAR